MEIDSSKLIDYIFKTLPIIAIVISLLTIYFTRRNVKKQIRVNKLEEILEIIYSTTREYPFLFWVITDMRRVKELSAINEFISEGYLNYTERIEEYLKYADEEKLKNKLSRLQVLVTAYLPNNDNNLQFKIIALAEILLYIYQGIFSNELNYRNPYYINGIPKPGAFGKFVIEIEKNIIKEMDLGYESYSYEKYKKYKNGTFMKEMELEKPS